MAAMVVENGRTEAKLTRLPAGWGGVGSGVYLIESDVLIGGQSTLGSIPIC